MKRIRGKHLFHTLLCMLLVFSAAIACAPVSEAAGAKNKKRKIAGGCDATVWVRQQQDRWQKGTWEEDGYHDAKGRLLADMELALSNTDSVAGGSADYPILYIGASRTANTADAVRDSSVFFYHCGGAGFRWFFNKTYHGGKGKEPALQVIRTYLAGRPDGTVIIDLGGNDLYNIKVYIGFYRQLISRYPQAHFWFMGILPRAKTCRTNRARRKFNLRLAKEFPGQVINLYDWVYRQPDFKTKDGIHYYRKLSRKIYKKTMEKIGRKVTVNPRTGKVSEK